MATTTNYGWTTPDDTALVKDGAAAIRTLGSSVDTTTKNLNPSTTLGDIEYRSSTANVNTRLGLGTAGQVLTVNSGATAPEWAAPAAGGMTLINTGGTTLTGASVSISSIPATYVNLVLIIRDFLPATDGAELLCRVNGDSNANRHNYWSTNSSNNGGDPVTWSSSSFNVADGDNAVTENLSYIEFFDYSNTTTWKMGRFTILSVDQTTNTSMRAYNGWWGYNQTGAISSLSFLASSGNMTSGTAFLYGVK
jgi:hypothetical protein